MNTQAVRHMVKAFVGGESAILPCGLRCYNRTTSTVVVSRDDLNPKNVHIQEPGDDWYNKQNKLFKNRTSWIDTLGDLTLHKPQISDSGTYTCILRELGEERNKTQIQLDVEETFGHKFSGSWDVFLLGFLVGFITCILIVIAAVLAFRYWKKTRAAVASVCKMIVREGESSVKMPFQITTRLNPGDIVEWLCVGLEPKVVCHHVIGANEQMIPHKFYNERSRMTNLQQTDLSLTVSAPRKGTYICTVCRDGETLFQEEMELRDHISAVLLAATLLLFPALTPLPTQAQPSR